MVSQDAAIYQPGLANLNNENENNMVMWTSGTVFCSMSKEELEDERKAAEEDYERYRLLVLAEKAAAMTKEDFIVAEKIWEEKEQDHEEFLHRLNNNRSFEVDWERYKYERESYNTGIATALKAKRWKHYNIAASHVVLVLMASLAFRSYNNDLFLFTAASWISLVYFVSIGINWYEWYKSKGE
jgi:hypothetical protein